MAQAYHYFQLFTEGERKNQMSPTHSFDAERCAVCMHPLALPYVLLLCPVSCRTLSIFAVF